MTHKLPDPPKALDLSRPVDRDYGPYFDYNRTESMKFVESLRGKYPDSTFWIIGTDTNLDFYPNNFFDDKLSIALNFACIGFPNNTYFCSSHRVVANAIVNKLGFNYLNKSIFVAICREYYHPTTHIWWEDYGLDPIYAKILGKDMSAFNEDDQKKLIEQINNEGTFELIGGKGIINYAIQIAALFGAKKIILVGCSDKGGKVYYHAQKRGMSEFYRDEEWSKREPGHYEKYRTGRWSAQIMRKQETMMLVKLFKKYNIEVMRHRFDEEKNEFVFKEYKIDE